MIGTWKASNVKVRRPMKRSYGKEYSITYVNTREGGGMVPMKQ